MTLLEIMIAAAIGLITIAAAMAMLTGLRRIVDDSDRTLTAVSNLQLGTAVLQRGIENAGYHFPSPQAAITVHKNVAVGVLHNGTGNAPNGDINVIARPAVSDVPYAGQEGVIADSDVIEVLTGSRTGNTVAVNNPGSLSGSSRDIFFQAPAGSDVLNNVAPIPNPVLLFRSATAECIGEITGPAIGYLRYPVQMLDSNLQPDPAPPANCPVANMTVYRLESRTRYMVYQFAGETRPMLAIQRMDATQPTVGVLSTTVEPLVEGIEDMQAAALMTNQGGLCPAGQACVCDDGVDDGAGDCQLNQATGGNSLLMRGVVLEFTSRGQRDRAQFQAGLPASMDRPAGAIDNVSRQQFRLAVASPNLNPSLVAVGPVVP